MLEELEEISPKDIDNYYYVKNLKDIFHISNNTVYKMLKEISPKKYKIKTQVSINNSYSYYVLVHKDCLKQFEEWILNRHRKEKMAKYNVYHGDYDDDEPEEEPKEELEIKFSDEQLEKLKALHPLVTDFRFFKDSYFPNIELEEIVIE